MSTYRLEVFADGEDELACALAELGGRYRYAIIDQTQEENEK